MSFRAYDESFADRLTELSVGLYACQAAFRELAEETKWRPASGSAAERDLAVLVAREPPNPTGTATLIGGTVYFYLSAASEHLGALGALYAKREVLIPPPALVRCVLEHCARVLWILQQGDQATEDRLARVYLEVLFSAVEFKKTTGRLNGKESADYQSAVKTLKELRDRAKTIFGDPISDEDGRDTLRGHQMMGLEECVAWMVDFIKQATSAPDQRGIYDYISNVSHPTIYPHAEMWEVALKDGEKTFASQVTIEDHEKRVALAIVPFCETLSHVMSYNGWPRRVHEQLIGTLEELLPGMVATAQD